MAFDACMMRAVLSEIQRDFADARIEKVLMPANDEVDLCLHAGKKSARLVFNVGPNAPRLQLSNLQKDNPKVPPMFCMLLRKHLTGGRLTDIRQVGFDRIARFAFSAMDDLGYSETKILYCEIMGKYANLILTDANEKIISALKLIDFSDSTIRQILPGLSYTAPAAQGKTSPLTVDRDFFMQAFSDFGGERTVEKFITSTYGGIATQVAHEICFLATGKCDTPLLEISPSSLYVTFSAWQKALIDENYQPTAFLDQDGHPKDYCYMPLSYFGYSAVGYPSFDRLFDAYFEEKDRVERIRQRGHDLLQLLSNAESRTEKKLALQRQALLDSELGETYKKRGDLITANLYRLSRGMTSFTTPDYYSETAEEIEVPLDARLSPSANAQRMYKQYNKCKKAKEVLSTCIAEWEAELSYLASVRDFLSRAESEQDLFDIRDEMYRSGYASRMKDYKPQKVSKCKPIEAKTSGGYEVLIGRNNTQNDYLTFKIAEKGDIWFHVKDMPGSHVILRAHGEEPSDLDYTEAAALAAKYSQAKGSSVSVDYTRVKNIKKPAGAKPGFVIYHTNYSCYVTPAK